MTLLQNQARVGLPNTLHDEGVPNTLSRMNQPVPIGQMRLPAGVLVAVVALITAGLVVAIILAR